MDYSNFPSGATAWWFALLILWSLVWKGLALWRAARNSHTAWYVVMMIVNTAGILEIIYYFGFGNKKAPKTQ
jgi:methionyl-tRNA synthetase